MRQRLPDRRGIALEVGFPEACHTLVTAGRIEHADIEVERLADPVPKLGMIGKIVVGQRMNQRAQPRGLDDCNHVLAGGLVKMNLELRDRMRAAAPIGHTADEQDVRSLRKSIPKLGRLGAIQVRIIDMGVKQRGMAHAAFNPRAVAVPVPIRLP